ncbi:MAG TPA: UGSC family (seleno)protein [Candidatus Acidoferrum sp.]|nr:UGSC family (seleno)protein [Candidatus Acidoferrum sp.]
MGVPAVPIITEAYRDLAKSTAAQRGMPTLRIAFTVHPVWGKTPEQLRALVDGADPVTKAPFMKEIIGGLTTPLTAEDQISGLQPVSLGPATFGPDTADNLQKYFMDNQMTDYMPIIIPTEEKVAAMLKGTTHQPDEAVGRTAGWKYTVKQVAVNAVMAGCDPSYFPVILAIASTGELALGGSTTSFGYALVINGPIRDKLNMNYTIGALSPFAQPNATIGRAWSLLGKNLGPGSIPGQTYWGGQGNNLNYNNVVIVEDEKSSPWTPFHVQKGFKPEESVVSVFNGWDMRMGHGAKGAGAMQLKFDEQISSMFPTLARMFNCVVVCDPLTAKALVDQGYDTKDKLQAWLWKNSTITAKEYRESFLAHVWLYPRALKGEEPYATWWKAADDERIPCWPKAENIELVVTGGQTNAFFQVGNMNYGRSVSIDKWT